VALLDPFRGIFNRPARVAPTETLGVGGAVAVGGYLDRNERSTDLVGTERYRTFSDILANVSIAAAGIRFFLNLVAKAGWKFEPAEGVPGAIEYAEKTEAAFYGMETPWSRVVRRSAMFRMHGFAIQEWTAKRMPDGTIGFLDVAPRPQVTIERWDLERSGNVLGVIQRAPATGEEIYLPRQKIVYAVDDSLADTPEGLGLFRHMVEPAKRLRAYQLLEAYGFESDLVGVPLARAPLRMLEDLVKQGALSEADREAILSPLKAFLQNHAKNPQLGLLLDSEPFRSLDEASTPSSSKKWEVETMTSETATLQERLAASIERLNREIARVLGVEGLLLGATQTGSLALSQDKSQNFGLIVDSTLTECKETFQDDLVKPLFRLNGWPEEAEPTLKTDATQYRDILQVTSALAQMATAGAVLAPEDPAIAEVRDLLGISRPLPVELADAEDAALGEDADAEDEEVEAPEDEDEGAAIEDEPTE
jgi:hypothetical protein